MGALLVHLVARRIRMRIDSWERTALREQEQVLGREKITGAPLGASAEHDPVPLALSMPDGMLVIPADAHIRSNCPAQPTLRILPPCAGICSRANSVISWIAL